MFVTGTGGWGGRPTFSGSKYLPKTGSDRYWDIPIFGDAYSGSSARQVVGVSGESSYLGRHGSAEVEVSYSTSLGTSHIFWRGQCHDLL
jgi:hypothetical protein